MAFAGNDMVNFIGVPLAGFFAWTTYNKSDVSEHLFNMQFLADNIQTPNSILIIAALIMVATLWLSKKSKTVTETSINLSRQDIGYERFGSTKFSRFLVKNIMILTNNTKKIIPKTFFDRILKKYEKKQLTNQELKNVPAFDLIRASVNLVVASIIITIGTSLKLPLSTTYITFMVAMGTSLSDGAWNSETAVFRVTGFIWIVGGWFITAFLAFLAAFFIANIIYFGGAIAVSVIIIISFFIFYKSKIYHNNKVDNIRDNPNFNSKNINITSENVFNECTLQLTNSLEYIPRIFDKISVALKTDDLNLLKKARKKARKFNKEAKFYKEQNHKIIHFLKTDSLQSVQNYIQVTNNLNEVSNATLFLVIIIYDFINKKNQKFKNDTIKEFEFFKNELTEFLSEIYQKINYNNFDKIEYLDKYQLKILNNLEKIKTLYLNYNKDNQEDDKNNEVFLNMLIEYNNLIICLSKLLKSQKEFIENRYL